MAVLRDWVARTRAGLEPGVELRVVQTPAEATQLAELGDAAIAPVRVAWLPPGRDGDRRWRRRDLIKLRHPSGLSVRERERIMASEPGRCRVLVGEPARLSELRARMLKQSGRRGRSDLARFVDSQARLTLDRSERVLTGSRYKVPHDIAQELVGSRHFEEGVRELAEQLHRSESDVREEALTYLAEMASTQSALARELWALLARSLYSRAYELSYDPQDIERLRKLGAQHPLVFLPTHKSNLDGYVMAALLYDQGFPPNHALGGINMAFWPLGPLGRRVGVIWIRRTIRGNPVYAWVLRQYISHLIGRRFNLEWYIEGGRSRTGKLLPPKLGLLRYLVDAIDDAGVDDVQIVPVSIVYDQLEELAEMTAESRGAVKPPEGLRWLVDYARRQSRPSGRVQVRFGEPLAIAPALRANGVDTDPRLAVSKLAFEVCTRINRATPLTRSGLISLVMLGADERALTAREVRDLAEPLLRYSQARRLPGAEDVAELTALPATRHTLGQLVEHGVIHCFDKGPEPVYAVGPDEDLVAAFHRNTVIHWFVNRSIAELALVRAAEDEPNDDPVEVAWSEAFRLREVLKFEFFFSDKERFRDEMREELTLIEPRWHSGGELSLGEVGRALACSGTLTAHRVLPSFLESYYVVAERLLGHRTSGRFDEPAFLAECLPFAQQLRLQRRITSGEAVSKELFRSALKLAANRGLLEGDELQLAQDRAAFAAELRDLVRRTRVLATIDHNHRTADVGLPAALVA
jgi:glycerol-3-phosphate O-acyltransferase